MPSEETKILEFNQYYKSDKAPFVIYVVLECIIKKIDECKNNPKNSFTTKVSKHIPSGFSICPISSLRNIEISMIYIEVKITWKHFVNFWESMQ